jgi:proteasome lid subunit RPN8/RPN11
MGSLLRTLWHNPFGKPPKLACHQRLWNEGVDELRRRAGGYRESGAFLLGTAHQGVRIINRFLYYDDVDPSCFNNGIVEFDGSKFGIVWQICRDTNMTVVADVHVHPGGYGQSGSDRTNPMIAESGHVAIILPDFARCKRKPGGIGIYEYLGSRRWHNHSPAGKSVFRIDWWPL